MDSQIENITPNMAKKYLENNKVNRNLSQSLVDTYAGDMARGGWQLNGDSIKFYDDGSLFDGQHRLMAIVKSGKTIATFVMRNIPTSVTITDFGRKRSDVDTFILEGKDTKLANNSIIALIKLHYYIQFGKSNVSHMELDNFISKHEDTLLNVSELMSKHSRRNGVNVKSAFIITAVFYALESGVDVKIIDRFLETLTTGRYGSIEEEAAVVLRNDIVSKRIDYHGGLNRRHACYATEKAIHDYTNRLTRKNTYSTYEKPTYSSNKQFKEEQS